MPRVLRKAQGAGQFQLVMSGQGYRLGAGTRCGDHTIPDRTIQDTFNGPGVSVVARLTTAASPTLLNEFVFSYSADHISFKNNGAWQRPPGYNLGLFQNGFGGGKLPGISLRGGIFNGIDEDAGYVPNGPLNSNPAYSYRDNISKIIGRHNLQFGAYFVASQKNELPQFEPSVNGFLTSTPARQLAPEMPLPTY